MLQVNLIRGYMIDFDINLYAQNDYKNKNTERIKRLVKMYREMLRGKEPLNYELENKK
jgi:hypothetical protein